MDDLSDDHGRGSAAEAETFDRVSGRANSHDDARQAAAHAPDAAGSSMFAAAREAETAHAARKAELDAADAAAAARAGTAPTPLQRQRADMDAEMAACAEAVARLKQPANREAFALLGKELKKDLLALNTAEAAEKAAAKTNRSRVHASKYGTAASRTAGEAGEAAVAVPPPPPPAPAPATEALGPRRVAAAQAAPSATSAAPAKFETISTFYWEPGEYNSPDVTVCVPLNGVRKSTKEDGCAVTCEFTKESFDLRVAYFEKTKHYRMLKDNLGKDIVPDASSFSVKKNKVVVKLRKAKDGYNTYEHWSELCAKRSRRSGGGEGKADPLGGINDIMRDMYVNRGHYPPPPLLRACCWAALLLRPL